MPRASPNRCKARRWEPRRQSPQLRRPGQQRRGLGANEQIVLLFAELQRVVRQQLPHLAHRHLVGHPTQHPQRLELVQANQLDHRARVQVVAHDDRDLVAEQCVDGRHAPAENGVVHRVVVHQGREVDQLDHGGQRGGMRRPGAGRLVGKQHDGGPKQLALHLQQVGVHVADQLKIASMIRRSSR